MTQLNAANYEIRSEQHGGHWIAWVVRPGETKPVESIIQVGQTREEAEANARRWAERIAADPGMLRRSH